MPRAYDQGLCPLPMAMLMNQRWLIPAKSPIGFANAIPSDNSQVCIGCHSDCTPEMYDESHMKGQSWQRWMSEEPPVLLYKNPAPTISVILKADYSSHNPNQVHSLVHQ